jgi:hypothetical protein
VVAAVVFVPNDVFEVANELLEFEPSAEFEGPPNVVFEDVPNVFFEEDVPKASFDPPNALPELVPNALLNPPNALVDVVVFEVLGAVVAHGSLATDTFAAVGVGVVAHGFPVKDEIP